MLKINLKTAFTILCACCILPACKKDHQNSEKDQCEDEPVFEWKKSAIVTDGAEGNFNFTIAADNTGNVYVASKINGSVDADPGDAVWEVHTNGVVLQKFNAEGKLVWASVVDAPVAGMHLDALMLVFDTQLNTYLYTSYSSSPYQFGRITRFDQQGNINNAGEHQYGNFLLAFDKQGSRYDIGFENKLTINNRGNLLAEKSTVDDPGFSAGIIDLKVSPNGNIYLLGRAFNKDANFDPAKEAHIKLTEQPTNDKPAIFYVQKLDAQTNFLWVTQVGIGAYSGPVNMLIDKTDNVYINSVDPGDWRYNTLRKLANDGTLAWKNQVIKSGSIMLDGEDNLYVDGYLQWERYSTLTGELTWSTFADDAYNGHIISTGDGRTMYSVTPDLITSSNYTKATLTLRKYTFCGR